MNSTRSRLETSSVPDTAGHLSHGFLGGRSTHRSTLAEKALWVSIVVALASASSPALAAVKVTSTVELGDEIDWFYESDIGMLHVYGAGQLHSLDLLDGGRSVHEPINLPGAEDPGSVVHLPGMPYLFVPSAVSKLKAREKDDGPFSSYLIDAFSGELIWEHAPRADVSHVFVFPFEDRFVIRTGKQGEIFTGLALSSGEPIWNLTVPAKAVWTHGPVLEIVGETSASIDAVTGEYLRKISIPVPEKADVVTFPGSDVIVVWLKDDFAAYEYPALEPILIEDAGSERTVVAKKLWEFESKKKAPTKLCQQDHVPCGPMMLPKNRVLLNGVTRIELLDLETGEVMWSRKEKKIIAAAAVSPSGKYGAVLDNKEVTIINMETGEDVREIPYPKGAKPKFQVLKASYGSLKAYASLMAQVVWPNEDEVVVITQNKKGLPHGVMRFHAEDRKLVWGRELPDPADYPMTSSERGILAGRILLSIALTAVSAANPIPVGNTSYYFVFTPNWRVQSSPDLAFDPYSREGLQDNDVPQQFQESRRRYLRRQELLQDAQDKDTILVTGDHGTYTLDSIDLKTGETTTLGPYRGKTIHSIDPDSVYRLAVTLEKQRRVLRVLSLSD